MRECVGKATVTKTINGAVSCAVIILVILILIARYCCCCCCSCCYSYCCLLIAFSLAPAVWHFDNFRLLFWFRFAAVCTRLVAVCLLFIALTLTHSLSLTRTRTVVTAFSLCHSRLSPVALALYLQQEQLALRAAQDVVSVQIFSHAVKSTKSKVVTASPRPAPW